MSDADLMSLYSTRLLELTVQIPHLGRLSAPQGTGSARSAQCGSTVSVQLCLDAEGAITEFAQEVRACALGQAAAALLGQNVIGLTASQLSAARQQVAQMLQGGPLPQAPFEGFEVLTAARPFANRHASILLALDATLEALEQANASR